MEYYSSYITKLVEQLGSLPGIGRKTAQRLAFHIMNMPKDRAQALADSITEARAHVRYCSQCFTLTDDELCPICIVRTTGTCISPDASSTSCSTASTPSC